MRLPEVIQVTGYKRSSIYQLMQKGKFPKPRPLGARAVGWSSEEVQEWVDSCLRAGAVS
ncbi:helix-turn-helix transcriptional regulator [Pseudomonas fluorescens]|uniref:helix-turn-helix transcriptional regulator n=1 Tax=Pseudomonas fluorescens TaxID=294 RepID=UPI001241C813|nr:AlpA family transcriptional regulator [Pseudomonas fluorescens]